MSASTRGINIVDRYTVQSQISEPALTDDLKC
jgi:hypothetical protein